MLSGGNNKNRNRCRSQKKKRSGFKDGPDNPLEVIFQVPYHGEVGKAKSNKRSDNRCNNRNRNMCRGGKRAAIVAGLGRGFASKLIFAFKRSILARTATSERSSY